MSMDYAENVAERQNSQEDKSSLSEENPSLIREEPSLSNKKPDLTKQRSVSTVAWEELTLTNNYVFTKAMLDPDLCKDVVETILGIEIDHIEYPEQEKYLDVSLDSKGIRLDVYVKDEAGTVYNLEMQAFNQDNLKKRSRYYHALLAVDQLEKGRRYSDLSDAYVIFICDFDLFEQNKRIYRFESTCREIKDLTLFDGAHTIFVAASVAGTSNSKLDEFCEYVHKGVVTGKFSGRLESARTKVLENSKWRRDYMFLSDIKYEAHEEGREEGRAEGREEGSFLTLSSLVDKGLLSKEVAAAEAHMTVEEFEKQKAALS